jgi:hypothetical protein
MRPALGWRSTGPAWRSIGRLDHAVLSLAFCLLVAAGALGGGLGLAQSRNARSTRLLRAPHGVLAFLGFITLLLGLRGPPRGEAAGVAGFGRIAAMLLALALATGLAMLVLRLRRWRIAGLAIGTHASVAISGIVILAAYVLAG